MASSEVGAGPSENSKIPNQLASSKSPYLRQHAYNPVNWFPWGDLAFQKAREENKLIFLSVGYSTCHWCHVMEHESFESEEIAKLMNQDYVNIKVDREERPDVDRMYMSFIKAISGGGGWPMSVWLTPDLKPVFGGTYFPPFDSSYNRPGFATILKSLAKRWRDNPESFKASAEKITETLEKSVSIAGGGRLPNAWACAQKCYEQLEDSYDPRFGGFNSAPKFPQPVNLSFLLRVYVGGKSSLSMKQKALDMTLHTLRMMAKGGIFDHVCLGFARYSTDERWHVPHFEKMLYDQAQLASVYAEAYLIKQDPDLAGIVRDIFTYVTSNLSDPSGGFYSAEDADSFPEYGAPKKREGAFCVWTYDEVQSVLRSLVSPAKDDYSVADVVCYHYDIHRQGNVEPRQDPHGELKGKNVLIIRGSEEKTAAKFGITVDVLREAVLQPALAAMKTARARRPPPDLDDKMITSWNGLMLSAFAKAGVALKDESYVERAIKAATFIQDNLYDVETGQLIHSCYQGPNGDVVQNLEPVTGFLDDYAFTIKGLLDLYTACQDEKWILWADHLQRKQNELFWDDDGGGYFISPAGDPSILIRLKDDQDGAEPAGNSVAVSNLERLSILVDRPEFHDMAGRVLCVFSERLEKVPIALPEMISAFMLYEESPSEVVVVGPRSSDTVRDLYGAAVNHTKSLLGQVVIRHDPADEVDFLVERKPYLTEMKTTGAFVCRNQSCSSPVFTPSDLRRMLDG